MPHWVGTTLQDFRYTLRAWRRAPAFAALAVATLAIGIGANTAIFSVVSGVLLRPLPFAAPGRLVQLYETQLRAVDSVGFDGPVVFQDFEEWRGRPSLFQAMASYSNSARNFQGPGEPQQVSTITSDRGLFRLLGVAADIGRTFTEGDPLNVAVISQAFWKLNLAEDRSIIGRSILLDGQPFTIIGVMPEAFQFPYASTPQALWIPWEPPPDLRSHPNRRLDSVIARMKPGVSIEAARQELNASESVRQGRRVARVRALNEVVSGGVRQSLLVLLGAVGMVLLVACLNVANLLLARTAARVREIAIRSAVGATRSRLIRQLLTESLALALAGGVAGLAIGIAGTRLLLRLAAAQIPRAPEIGLDWRVFAFLLAVCGSTGIAFGLAPALSAAHAISGKLTRRNIGPALRDTLVVVEIALAFVLLAGAGLLGRTFLNLRHTDPGLNTSNVLTMHVVIADGRESMAVEDRVSKIPGVRAAGMISLLPLQNSRWSGGLTITGQPGMLETELRYVTPGYFHAMGIPLRRGREFTPRDDAAAPPVILVNETLARQYFPGQDPVGRATDRGTIAGVVGDVHQASLDLPPKPEVYYPVARNFAQIRRLGSTLVVRTAGPPEPLAGAIRAAVREVSSGQALFRVAPMQEVIDESLANPRLYAWLVGLFAIIAMLLALAGIYGVIAYLVTLRTREFGIRMALGADALGILRFVMRRGGVLTAAGVALGATGATALTGLLRSVLYGVGPTDTVTFAAAAALLAAAALTACLAPARRAARVDPAIALRCE